MAKSILQKVIQRKKMHKKEFARRLKKDYSTTFRYFRPGYDPKLSVLTEWAKVLKCRVRDLFEE